MKALKAIISERGVTNYPSHKIVYEWEDILSRELNLPIDVEWRLKRKLYNFVDKHGLTESFLSLFPSTDLYLRFVMTAKSSNCCIINNNIIPVIIDFWLSDEQLNDFYKAYSRCPLVLITNAEVLDYLKNNNCPLNIEHWPLSIPDKLCEQLPLVQNNRRDIDFCVFGRPNPYFLRYLDQYSKESSDFEYVTVEGELGARRQYVSNKRRVIEEDTGRQSYLNMMRRTKITCYTTPGMDEAKEETNSYNQVTPRVLEMLCGGCWVIGHYPDNADTRFYDLRSVVCNVQTYDEFKNCMNKMRFSSPNYKKIEEFVNNHKTSTRVESLKRILTNNQICLCSV